LFNLKKRRKIGAQHRFGPSCHIYIIKWEREMNRKEIIEKKIKWSSLSLVQNPKTLKPRLNPKIFWE
jgi:hypothetical protein